MSPGDEVRYRTFNGHEYGVLRGYVDEDEGTLYVVETADGEVTHRTAEHLEMV